MQETKEELQDLLKIEGINCKGFGVIPKAVMLDTELTIEAKTIYAYFCSFAGNGTTAFPKRDTILFHLKITKDYYYKHFKLLEEQGFLKVERTGSFPYKNIYTLINNPKKFNDSEAINNKNYSQIKYNGLKSKGFGTVPRALMLDDRLNIKSKGIYAYFCSYAGSGTSAFPKFDKILYHLKLSINTYYKYYNQLISCNYITVLQRKSESGQFNINDYILNENPNIEIGELLQSEKNTPFHKIQDNDKSMNSPSEIPFHKIQDNDKSMNITDIAPLHNLQDNVPLHNLPYHESPYHELPYNDTPYIIAQDTIINSSTKNSFTKNQSIIPDRQIDKEIYRSILFDEILKNKGLYYSYKLDKERMTEAIHIICEWETFHPNGYADEQRQSIYDLAVDCLIEMACCDLPMKLKGSIVSYDNIIDKINDNIVYGDFNEFMSIHNFIEDVINDYENASKKYEIKAHVQYMKACIWNCFLSHKVKFNSMVNKIV